MYQSEYCDGIALCSVSIPIFLIKGGIGMNRKTFLGLMCTAFAVFLITATCVEAAKPICGDGVCSSGENASKCPDDCLPSSFCGDAICDPDEDQCSCENDCGLPPSTEVSCDNGIDDDCDDLVDCADMDCTGNPLCPLRTDVARRRTDGKS